MVVSRRWIAARAALKGSLVAALLCLGARSAADPLDPWALDVAEASNRFGVPPEWIRRVMTIESGGHARIEGRPVVSRAGAMGLMQLMPGTWRGLRSLLNLGPDPFEPRDNILAGTAYLRLMYDRFGYPGLFAAYNAGPGRYAGHLATGRRLPPETVAYVATVTRTWDPTQRLGPLRRPAAPATSAAREAASRQPMPTLFAVRGPASSSMSGPAGAPTGLFVRLSGAAER
jgi:soluble lytic murein transglycosylase-like protein